jgi:hypothetical protein
MRGRNTLPQSAESRQHPRARARIKVEYHFGSTTGVGHTNDISEGGIFLTCSPIAPVGTRIYLRLHLPGSQAGEPLKIIGMVTRSVEKGPQRESGMGVHFEVAYSRTRESLGGFVDDLLTVSSSQPVARPSRDIVAVQGSTDKDPEYAVRFPSVTEQPTPPQFNAEQVQQAFAFKPAEARGSDWSGVRRAILGAFIIGAVIAIILTLNRCLGDVFSR